MTAYAAGLRVSEVEMIFERLIPSVEYRNESDLSAKMPMAKLEQRFTDRFEQNA